MGDQVSLSAGISNFHDCGELASDHGLGLELMAFSLPSVLDGDWRALVRAYRTALATIPGVVTLHGPFMDLVSGSPGRTHQYGDIRPLRACDPHRRPAGHHQVILHANYIGLLHNEVYRQGWHQRNVDFWGPLGRLRRAYGVVVAIENMWEFDPSIIGNLLAELDHPNLKACIDVGHATLFSDPEFTVDNWLDTLAPWVIELHQNNNNGVMDEHYGFDWDHGVLYYARMLEDAAAKASDGAGDGPRGRYEGQPALF